MMKYTWVNSLFVGRQERWSIPLAPPAYNQPLLVLFSAGIDVEGRDMCS
jgi:hypothetical protein